MGKTTLLKILAGLLEPSNGRVLGSKPWWQRLFLTSATSEVVYLHQSPYLFDDTVYQNVVYGIRFSGLSAHENARK